jgi:transposase
MKNFLSPEDRAELQIREKKEKDAKVLTRVRIILLADKGKIYKDIADFYFIDPTTVGRTVDEYVNEDQKLTPQSPGSRSKLTEEQTTELTEHLIEPTSPTTEEICEPVKEEYQVSYHPHSRTRWLREPNFSYKKPDPVPAKADPEAQARFLEAYKKFMAEKPADEPVLWVDGVHPTMETKIRYGWIKKGTKKPIATTASRTRVNELGALELAILKLVLRPFETINEDSVVSFFERVRQEWGAPKIHIFLDKDGYFRTEKVRKAVERLNIELHFLPTYSPNLNAIETLWKVQNKYVRNNVFFKSPADFREALRKFAEEIWDTIREEMRGWINDNFRAISQKPVIA